MNKKIKVALYGNVCNNFYALAKCLRNNNIADAHLYLNDSSDIQNRPESDDPDLLNNYPDWIHLDRRWDPFLFLKRFDKSFIKELNKYDIVFLSDHGLVLAPYITAKKIFFVTGADLTRIPFSDRYLEGLKGLKIWLAKKYIPFMQRRGIRSCDKIIAQPFKPYRSALKRLRVSEKLLSSSYYPILVDEEKIKTNPDAWNKIDPINKEKLRPFKFFIFHPSRLFIQKIPSHIETGHWKGNDNLIMAFAIFIKKYNVTDACLAMPERIHSPDIAIAKKMIEDLGITDNVVWLNPPNKEGFPRNDLINFYSISDLITDEFATGWFGSIVIEGAACSKPTFCYVEESVMKKLYPYHPIISEKDPEKLADLIAKFYHDKAYAMEIGETSRKWALEFHSLKNGSHIYANNLTKDIKAMFN
jgi:glycosyltransferase involved in cell wall biosynthesis